MPASIRQLQTIVLLATLASACAVEVADQPELELEHDPTVEPVDQALTNPAAQFAVWLNEPARPLAEDFVPDAGYRLNVSHVRRIGTGRYLVFLNQLAIPFVLPFVSAYGDDSTRCKIEATGFIETPELRRIITVKCHTAGGSAANSRFVLNAFDPHGIQGRAAGGVVLADGTAVEEFNTVGTTAATRTSAGNYIITLTNLGSSAPAGTVQVSAVGATTRHCKVVSFGATPGMPTLQTINVRCFITNSDTAADSEFFFLYDQQIPTRNNRGAYSWANNATSPSYQPNTSYTFMRGPRIDDSSSSATGSLMSGETGRYKMVYHGLSEDISWEAYLFVGAYGGGSEYCKIRNWSRVGSCQTNCDIEAQTLCFDKTGARTNTRYVQTWGSFTPLVLQ